MAVAKPDLKLMAEELESLLAATPRPVVSAPAVAESFTIAAEPTLVPEAQPNNDHLIPNLIRSVVEYTLSRSPERAEAHEIGGAITAGINEAIKRLDLDRTKVVEAVEAFLEDLNESVLDSLVE